MGASAARDLGAINWRGLWTLYRRELARFFRYGLDSLGGPAVSALLFLATFLIAFGGADGSPDFAQFIAPGIAMFTLLLSAFWNGAVPIIHDKHEGIIQDLLMAPLSPLEAVAGFALSAATAGLVTGLVVTLLMSLFVDLPLHSLTAVLGFAAAGGLLFALVGFLVGLWADKWEHYSAAENFLVLPLGVLSGAFFSLERVPPEVRFLIKLNPAFHVVDGFRYGFTGQAQGWPEAGMILICLLDIALGLLVWRLFAIGYKIKP